MLLQGHFQNAYIANDLDRAMARFERQYGEQRWIRYDPDMVLKTPEGDRPAQVRVALAWIGGLQVEIIEPVAGHVEAYRAVLAGPDDEALRFHHVCMRRDDLDAMQAEIDASGLPRAWESAFPGGYFVYLDARETLGHYLEYLWAEPEAWAAQGWPEGRPV